MSRFPRTRLRSKIRPCQSILKIYRSGEILALAISLEEEDARTYGDIANALRESYPASAEIFRKMIEEENEHRRKLFEIYRGAVWGSRAADSPDGCAGVCEAARRCGW